MINSIPITENKRENVFGQVTNTSGSSAYWLKNTKVSQSNSKDTVEVNNAVMSGTSPLQDLKILTPNEARKTNNIKIIGISIASATVVTAGAIFFILKGGTKKISRMFSKLRNNLEQKVQNAKLEGKTEDFKSGMTKFYVSVIKTLDKWSDKADIVNNFTTVKDILFKRFMYSCKPFAKIHDGISRFFEKLGRQSVVNSYNKTNNKFEIAGVKHLGALRSILKGNASEIIDINGIKLTRSQWLTQLKAKNDEFGNMYDEFFGKGAQNSRYFRFKIAAEDVKAAFSKLNVFWSKDMYSKFIAESAISKEKLAIKNAVKLNRRQISYSISDMAKSCDDQIIKITELIHYRDVDNISLLRNIRKQIAQYGKNPSSPHLKEQIVIDIAELKASVKKSCKLKSMDEDSVQSLSSAIDSLERDFVDFKPGKLEEMLDIYKKLLSPAQYNDIEKAYKKAVKSLDKTLNLETEEFVSKLRDLALGSAPTDILTMLAGLGTLGYQLGKSDSNDERLSISLKYGFPAIAGIGTMLYCNAKLFAGTKSLIIGSLSTFILNKIGEIADNKIKEYRVKKSVVNPNV